MSQILYFINFRMVQSQKLGLFLKAEVLKFQKMCVFQRPCMNYHILLSYSPILLDPRLVDPMGSNIVTDGCVITILFRLHSRQTCVLSGCGGADLLWLGVEDCQTRDWAPHKLWVSSFSRLILTMTFYFLMSTKSEIKIWVIIWNKKFIMMLFILSLFHKLFCILF